MTTNRRPRLPAAPLLPSDSNSNRTRSAERSEWTVSVFPRTVASQRGWGARRERWLRRESHRFLCGLAEFITAELWRVQQTSSRSQRSPAAQCSGASNLTLLWKGGREEGTHTVGHELLDKLCLTKKKKKKSLSMQSGAASYIWTGGKLMTI